MLVCVQTYACKNLMADCWLQKLPNTGWQNYQYTIMGSQWGTWLFCHTCVYRCFEYWLVMHPQQDSDFPSAILLVVAKHLTNTASRHFISSLLPSALAWCGFHVPLKRRNFCNMFCWASVRLLIHTLATSEATNYTSATLTKGNGEVQHL